MDYMKMAETMARDAVLAESRQNQKATPETTQWTAGERAAHAELRPEPLTLANVEDAFQYHPWSLHQEEAGDQVREALVMAAKVILRVVPPGPDRSVALRKLREARMDSNSAITHGGRF